MVEFLHTPLFKSDPSKISNIFQPNNFYFDGSEAVSLSKLPIV